MTTELELEYGGALDYSLAATKQQYIQTTQVKVFTLLERRYAPGVQTWADESTRQKRSSNISNLSHIPMSARQTIEQTP